MRIRRVAFTFATCQSAFRWSSRLARSTIVRSVRLPRAGSRMRIAATAAAGGSWAPRSASSEMPRSPVAGGSSSASSCGSSTAAASSSGTGRTVPEWRSPLLPAPGPRATGCTSTGRASRPTSSATSSCGTRRPAGSCSTRSAGPASRSSRPPSPGAPRSGWTRTRSPSRWPAPRSPASIPDALAERGRAVLAAARAEEGHWHQTRCRSCGGTARLAGTARTGGVDHRRAGGAARRCGGTRREEPSFADMTLARGAPTWRTTAARRGPPVFRGWQTRKLLRAGLQDFGELFTPRNLRALGAIRRAILAGPPGPERDLLLLALTGALAQASRMMADHSAARRRRVLEDQHLLAAGAQPRARPVPGLREPPAAGRRREARDRAIARRGAARPGGARRARRRARAARLPAAGERRLRVRRPAVRRRGHPVRRAVRALVRLARAVRCSPTSPPRSASTRCRGAAGRTTPPASLPPSAPCAR